MRLLKLIDKWVYSHSKKPKHYKRVKKPPRSWVEKLISPQDARQQQYNNWCKRYGIYSGSYLPDNPDELLKKGWREFTSPKDKTGLHREFQRKSTGQIVRYASSKIVRGRVEDKHYHWDNASSLEERRKLKELIRCIDRYGDACPEHSPESHLAPKDRDYNFRK